MTKSLTREKIVDALVEALECLDYVRWMGEFGAAAAGRLDEYSDADLAVVADDDRVEDVFGVTEQVLSSLAPLDLAYRRPYPSRRNQTAAFYHLQGTSPYLLLSLGVLGLSSETRFLPEAIQGRPLVYFDKLGKLPCDPLDREELFERIQERVDDMRFRLEHCQVKIFKEVNRGKPIEALNMYQQFALWALVDVLRIKHCPLHYRRLAHDIYDDLPSEVVARLEPLFFPTDIDDLRRKRAQATAWMAEVLQGIDLDKVRRLLG
jgi:hypothetical protein